MAATGVAAIVVFLAFSGATLAQIVPMTNDECSAAVPVAVGVNPAPAASGHVFTNVGATNSGLVPSMCIGFTGDVWFSFVASSAGAHAFATCTPPGFVSGTLSDSVIQVFDGAPTCGFLLPGVACNDDFCGTLSSVTVALAVGQLCFVRVAAFGTNVTGGTFYLTVTAPVAPPMNDDCPSATALAPGINGPFSNNGATSSSATSTCGNGFRDVWFSYTPACGGAVSITTPCVGLDTIVTVYSACGGGQLACSDDAPAGCVGGSQAVFAAAVGTTYRVRVASFANLVGTFTVLVDHPMTLSLASPTGAGSLVANIAGGPAGAAYYLAATLNQGAFPNGWCAGIDIAFPDVVAQLAFGAPFVGVLDACGGVQIGPFAGVPPVSLYCVAFGFPGATVTAPTEVSAPVTHSIP